MSQQKNSTYCDACLQLDLEQAFDAFPEATRIPLDSATIALYKRRNDHGEEFGQRHHANYYDLNHCQCAICVIMLAQSGSAFKSYLCIQSDIPSQYKLPDASWNYRLVARRYGFAGFTMVVPTPDFTGFFVIGAVEYCAFPDDPEELKTRYSSRSRELDFRSPDTIGLMNGWISQCQKEHRHRMVDSPDHPARLIDVGDRNMPTNQVKLVPWTGECDYVALSYTWGYFKGMDTKPETLTKRSTGIDMSGLSQTHRDAIQITRDLGKRFLWVDAFCIIQGKDGDWSTEGAKMDTIYEKAYVTISACRASSALEGFLTSRRYRTRSRIPRSRSSTYGPLVIGVTLDEALDPDTMRTMPFEPLSRRGWALQERCLSTRTIFFGTHQLSFECAHSFINEDSYRYFNPPNHFNSRSEPLKYSDWRDLIQDYTSRDLTVKTDVLQACSGLARAFRRNLARTSDEPVENDEENTSLLPGRYVQSYLAGLWRADLSRALCWRAKYESSYRHDPYLAPSWSWASIIGPVLYDAVSTSSPADVYRSLATIRDAETSPSAANRYGPIRAGWLAVAGRVHGLKVQRRGQGQRLEWSLDHWQTNPGDVVASWDCEEECERMTRSGEEFSLSVVWMFSVRVTDRNGRDEETKYLDRVVGLMIRGAGKAAMDKNGFDRSWSSKLFERVGLFQFTSDRGLPSDFLEDIQGGLAVELYIL